MVEGCERTGSLFMQQDHIQYSSIVESRNKVAKNNEKSQNEESKTFFTNCTK